MAPISLLIDGGSPGQTDWHVTLAFQGKIESFSVRLPDALPQILQSWRQRFLRHHDATQSWPEGAAMVRDWSSRLDHALRQWLDSSEWFPLQRVLLAQPDLPLQLQLRDLPTSAELLPWELGWPGRRVWRMSAADQIPAKIPPARSRRPRVLLLVGCDSGLDLIADIDLLEQQDRQGHISLSVLAGSTATAVELMKRLRQAQGWDALVFLGHSQASGDGGALQLGDGSLISGQALEGVLREATAYGLRLVLLNSCSGLELAYTAARAGVAWTLCFLQPLPNAAARDIFAALLLHLEAGADLCTAVGSVRDQLVPQPGLEGCEQLLAVVAPPNATPFHLPLSKWRRFQERLRCSTRRQLWLAAAFSMAGVVLQLVPWNPLSSELLDRRLQIQRLWRHGTGQITTPPDLPALPSLAVLVMDERTSSPALGVPPAKGHVSRLALAEVLRRTEPDRVPRIGIDLVMDEMHPGTAELAEVLRRRQGQVITGYFGDSNLDPRLRGGEASRPLPELRQSGVQVRDLAISLPQEGSGPAKPRPLQLSEDLEAPQFAAALSNKAGARIPADSIIDWSLPWESWIHWIHPHELETLNTRVLLVGSSGQSILQGQEQADLFQMPSARRLTLTPEARHKGAASGSELPGVHVQAVLIQSLNMGHWLTPAQLGPLSLLSSGAGVLLAAAFTNRRQRGLIMMGISAATVPICLQLAVTNSILIPWLLPTLAMAATAWSRDD